MLAVPTISTLAKYIKNMTAKYGFCNETFEMLKKKAEFMKPEDEEHSL